MSVRNMARERIKKLLYEYSPESLDQDIEKEIQGIIKLIEQRDMK